MTAAFPPNGRGQINLPLLMSANGTGTLLPPPHSRPTQRGANACESGRKGGGEYQIFVESDNGFDAARLTLGIFF